MSVLSLGLSPSSHPSLSQWVLIAAACSSIFEAVASRIDARAACAAMTAER
jgi:hypothetical protein